MEAFLHYPRRPECFILWVVEALDARLRKKDPARVEGDMVELQAVGRANNLLHGFTGTEQEEDTASPGAAWIVQDRAAVLGMCDGDRGGFLDHGDAHCCIRRAVPVVHRQLQASALEAVIALVIVQVRLGCDGLPGEGFIRCVGRAGGPAPQREPRALACQGVVEETACCEGQQAV